MADKKTKPQTKDLSALGVAELGTELRGALSKRATLDFQNNAANAKQGQPLKDSSELRKVRRNIARLKTYLRQKEAAK